MALVVLHPVLQFGQPRLEGLGGGALAQIQPAGLVVQRALAALAQRRQFGHAGLRVLDVLRQAGHVAGALRDGGLLRQQAAVGVDAQRHQNLQGRSLIRRGQPQRAQRRQQALRGGADLLRQPGMVLLRRR